jgi:DNA-binding beta-propeller fold protein YncE
MTCRRSFAFFCSAGLLASSFLIISAAGLRAAPQSSGYHVIQRIPIPADTGWDYITADTQGRRLYVPHGTKVVVLDLDTGAIVGEIAGQRGVHGVVVAPEFGHGFISATDPGSVTMFDLKTLAVLHKEKVGDDPNGIIYDPKTKRVYSADRGSKRLTGIDARTGKTAGIIGDLGGRTEHLAADGTGHVFLNMQDIGKLHELDVQGFKVMETWTLTPTCTQPSSMDMDTAHNRIFIGCRGGGQPAAPTLLAVVDATNGKIVATQPIGAGVDALEFDAKTGMIYVSTGGGDGALSIIHQDSPDQYTLVENVKTLSGARTMALDHNTGRVYLPVADVGQAPPPATPGGRGGRAPMIPGSFSVLVVGR